MLFICLFLKPAWVVCQPVHTVTIKDGEIHDFFDWNTGLSVPGETWHDAVSLYAEISITEVSITVTMASNFPPNAWFSLEFAFDTDLDEET